MAWPQRSVDTLFLSVACLSLDPQVVFAELVASLHEQGKSASQHLQELYRRYLPSVVAHCRHSTDCVASPVMVSSR